MNKTLKCPLGNRCLNFGTDICTYNNEFINCYTQQKIEKTFTRSNLPPDYYYDKKLKCTPDDPDFSTYVKLQQVEKNIGFYVNNGDNFYLYSEYKGNGKSAWACKILREYIIKYFVGGLDIDTTYPLFIDMRRFVAEYKPYGYSQTAYVQNILDHVYTAPLVVWDDILSGYKESAQILDWLGSVIEARVLSKKSNIYTSNTVYTNPELSNIIGPALYSRLIKTSIPLPFKGIDRRSFK